MASQDGDATTLIWERAEPAGRGATPAPDRAQIVAAAFDIADREGLHAVSVKRVASKIRIPSVRLEVYLTSREDLLDLMLDGAFAEIEPEDEGDDWRSRLRAMAHATQKTAQRHPWLRVLAGTRTPCGPNGLRHSERALSAVDGLGLDASTMTQMVNTVLAYVYGYVQLELVEHSRKTDADAEQARRAETARYLVAQVQTGAYPTLAQVFSDASISAVDAFESGLEYVLDGIGVRLAGSSAAGGGGTPGDGDGQDAAAAAQVTPADESPADESLAENEASTTGAGPGRQARFGRRRG
jgi:AcrR family transcriptional regulator